MAKKGGGKGGVLGSVAAIILIIGFLMAWANANGITSIDSALNYGRTHSKEAQACTDSGKTWFECWLTFDGVKTTPFNPDKLTPPDLSTPTIPGLPKVESKQLPVSADEIKVGPAEKVNYSRKEWKHWSKQSNGCTTRDNVLAAQGTDIVKSGPCKVVSGKWVDPYSGKTVTDPAQIDIDHVPPLNYVAAHGGNGWDAATKEKFANDTNHLLAVSAKENRAKGAKGPSEYMPPNEEFHCEYAQVWLRSAKSYGFTVTEKDKKVLVEALSTCAG